MYFLQFECEPFEGSPHWGKVKGALVSAWIKQEDEDDAERVACELILGLQWRIKERKVRLKTSRKAQKPEALKYYDEADQDGQSLLFHTYSTTDAS